MYYYHYYYFALGIGLTELYSITYFNSKKPEIRFLWHSALINKRVTAVQQLIMKIYY